VNITWLYSHLFKHSRTYHRVMDRQTNRKP